MFQGSMVALVTPMHKDGSIDDGNLNRLLDWHVEQGTNAIVIAGTTGESATLNMEEHCALIKRTVTLINGRIPVIAGTGANSTEEAIELTSCAQKVGVDACLLVTPYYNKPTQKGLYLHHKKIAETVDVPQILYNVPGRTACDMLPETIIKLSYIDNIVGVKEATGDLTRVKAIKSEASADFALYSGDDETGMDFILAGGQGVISVTANIVPKIMHLMCRAALVNDQLKANTLNQGIQAWHQQLFVESNPIPVKWVLHEMGLIKEGIRLPLTWLDTSYHNDLRQLLDAS